MSSTTTTPKAMTLPAPTQGPRGAVARTDNALARQADLRSDIDWEELRRVCSAAIKSGILPRGITREEQAVAIALKARELGVPPMQGFSSIHLIQGVASCSSNLMLGLAYKRLPEFSLRVIERTPAKCVMEFRRDSKREWVKVSYTIEEAQKAGLAGKDNWKAHPASMLSARVIGVGCRLTAPDVFAGLYSVEELEDGVPPDATTVREVDLAQAEPESQGQDDGAIEGQFERQSDGTQEPTPETPTQQQAATGPAMATGEQLSEIRVVFNHILDAVTKAGINATTAKTPKGATGQFIRSETGIDMAEIGSAMSATPPTLTAARAVEVLAALGKAHKSALAKIPKEIADKDAAFDDAIKF